MCSNTCPHFLFPSMHDKELHCALFLVNYLINQKWKAVIAITQISETRRRRSCFFENCTASCKNDGWTIALKPSQPRSELDSGSHSSFVHSLTHATYIYCKCARYVTAPSYLGIRRTYQNFYITFQEVNIVHRFPSKSALSSLPINSGFLKIQVILKD